LFRVNEVVLEDLGKVPDRHELEVNKANQKTMKHDVFFEALTLRMNDPDFSGEPSSTILYVSPSQRLFPVNLQHKTLVRVFHSRKSKKSGWNSLIS
jgi:hypothetical protein